MGSPKPPKPPDPERTAAAQTATNIGTAVANTAMGQVNQITPEGSLKYNQSGTFRWTDPIDGKVYNLPQYTATTSLSPAQQKIYNENQGAQLGLAQTANQQAGFLRDYLGKPAEFNTEEIEGRILELADQRLAPRFDREEDALRTRLANQGIAVGSEAFGREMEGLRQGENDAYTQLLLQGRGQAFNELAAKRNQPINEITALLSGSQVSMPNVGMANPAQAATTDYAGIVSDNYNQRLGAWQMKNQNRNQLLGGLFGLAGGLGGGYLAGM